MYSFELSKLLKSNMKLDFEWTKENFKSSTFPLMFTTGLQNYITLNNNAMTGKQ